MSAPELKPCPFCGANLDVSQNGSGRLQSVYHKTADCLLSGHTWWMVPRFWEPWNRRAKPQAEQLFDQQIADYVRSLP